MARHRCQGLYPLMGGSDLLCNVVLFLE
jgi:hypothetical protein